MSRRLAIRLSLALIQLAMLPLSQEIVLADQVRDAQWHLSFLHTSEATRLSEGGGVVVAVVDSGVDSSHPDLVGAILPGKNMGGAGDGRTDVNGHGTGVAGLIAARGRQGSSGVLGIAPKANILPVQPGGPGNPLIAEAVVWATLHGATVICVALATGPSGALEAAIRQAVDSDVVIVAGAGNDPNGGIQAPAKYDGVVAAMGVDRAGSRALFSPAGKESVLSAPAVDIVSTNTGGGYFKSQGTSDATAIIAGVAALVRSKFPNLSAREVVHRMTATAIDKGKPGRDDEYGYGIVNPVGALTADVPPLDPTQSADPSTATAQPPPQQKNTNSPALAWILGGVLLAAAGVGATLAIRRATR